MDTNFKFKLSKGTAWEVRDTTVGRDYWWDGRRQWWTMPPEDYDAQTCLEARLLPWGVYFGKNAKKGILT